PIHVSASPFGASAGWKPDSQRQEPPSPIRSAPSETTACPGSRETERACHHLKPPALLGSELHARHYPSFVTAELSVRSMIKSVASNTACLDALGGGPIMECCPPSSHVDSIYS